VNAAVEPEQEHPELPERAEVEEQPNQAPGQSQGWLIPVAVTGGAILAMFMFRFWRRQKTH
jgi:hypothetical protein